MEKNRTTKSKALHTEVIVVELADKTKELIEQVVGKSIIEATKLVQSSGKTARITRTDDIYHIGTA